MPFAHSVREEAAILLQTIGEPDPQIVATTVKRRIVDIGKFAEEKGVRILASLIVQEHSAIQGWDDTLLRFAVWRAAERAIGSMEIVRARVEFGLGLSFHREQLEGFEAKMEALEGFQSRIIERVSLPVAEEMTTV